MCEKCGCKIFKAITDGKCCMCCGKFIPDEIQVKEIDYSIRCCTGLPDEELMENELLGNNHLSPQVRKSRNIAYMLTVYDRIRAMIGDLKPWRDIDESLPGRKDCVSLQALRKYYHQEVLRRK